MRITIAQVNPIVGDVDGNLEKIIRILHDKGNETDLIVFPELCITGYPPRDLLEKPAFKDKVETAVQDLVKESSKYSDTGILIGAPVKTGKATGTGLYNSAVMIYQGEIIAYHHKSLLPAYDVFDETRYFDPADEIDVIPFKGHKLGVSICEDMWNDPKLKVGKIYEFDPMEELVKKGATILINISASPFHAGKEDIRCSLVKNHARKKNTPFLFVNQIGGNDELVFDGRSLCVDGKGELIAIFPSFKEHVETIDLSQAGSPGLYTPQDEVGSVHDALILGIKDYLRKCGFSKVVIGISGGIDSAVTCVLAKEALGAENVLGISMPSPFSSEESVVHSEMLAENLGIELKVISITDIYQTYIKSLENELSLDQKKVDVTLQNIQARIRGNILMAFSNKFGYLLLSTGNKSELAVGYCTLYGDMAGGLAVISDVPKKMVYQLAGYINSRSEVIPQQIIDKAPSAELSPGQLDQDSLPPYEELDQLLYFHLEEGCSAKELLGKGFDPNIVKWLVDNVHKNEYKRRQTPPGLKVTSKAFGIGRRMPIASRYDV